MYRRGAASALSFAIAIFAASTARGQACCAGSSAITPARLGLHDDALIGAQLRAATVTGSFNSAGRYVSSASLSSELDFEQDLFGSVRVLPHMEVAVLAPFVETRRSAHGATESGGGIGDLNASARYDFFLAEQSRYLPGTAALAGVTMPTGTAPEAAKHPLATDATGLGAFQGNLGLALEQIYGHWLVNATALVSKRAPRRVSGVDETLGTQVTGLLAGAYTLNGGAAVGALLSYTVEGDAEINGATAPESSHRSMLASLNGLFPISDQLRVQGSLFDTLPVTGRNSPAPLGVTFSIIRTWP